MQKWSPFVLRGAALGVAWLVLAVALWFPLFLASSTTVDLLGHRSEVSPTLGSTVELRPGAILPDVRVPSGSQVGAVVYLGRTDADNVDVLLKRYAVIASQPSGQLVRLRTAVVEMAVSAAVRAAALAALPIGVWLLLGSPRRRELWTLVRTRNAVIGYVVVVLLGVAVWQPWAAAPRAGPGGQEWQPLAEFLGPSIDLPPEALPLQARGDALSSANRRLVVSMVETYQASTEFYREAAAAASELVVRQPEGGEVVAMLVSDRHDNIGMDEVARAVFDRAGGSVVLNAGDDTSTGSEWEAFSLDSLDAAYGDFERFAVTGNHDEGGFVTGYLAGLGWRLLDGEVVTAEAGFTLTGVDDPRSSGLGSWRDETGLSVDEVGERLADEVCKSGTRVSTVLVHDVNLADEVLARGCADLVVGGHLHVRVGPTRVAGENGEVGYSYTSGTAGGAAYAIALGKIRREAMVSLITYRDDRPVGIQSVSLQTNGVFSVSQYAELAYADAATARGKSKPVSRRLGPGRGDHRKSDK
jgi:hypothetical protein